MIHSLGGGTGSGMGTYTLSEVLADLYPEMFKFSVCVFPSEDDDVITSPYNGLFACSKLVEHADCVFPVENQALFNIVNNIEKTKQNKKIKDNICEMESHEKKGV